MMSVPERLKPYWKYVKIVSILSASGGIVSYQISETHRRLSNVIKTAVLEKEKKMTPDYIYIDDITYLNYKNEVYKEGKESGLWRSVRQSVLWRLLRVCRLKQHRDLALQQIASIKKARDWECRSVAQCVDAPTAVDLARTEGCDSRFMLPPPPCSRWRIASTPNDLLDIITRLKWERSHVCLDTFLNKYSPSIQELTDSNEIPNNPTTISNRELTLQSLQMLHHHLVLFLDSDDDGPLASITWNGIHPLLAGILLQYPQDEDMTHAVLRLLAVLALMEGADGLFHLFGLLGYLTTWIKSRDPKLASTAALTLHNLAEKNKFRPGLYLLHPLYRSSKPACDVIIVHGLRGGVFYTWRQREPKDEEPLGLIDCLATYDNEKNESQTTSELYIADPYLSQVLRELEVSEEEELLSGFDVIDRDVPIETRRAHKRTYSARNKRAALTQEMEDKCQRTTCWPKDWLPKDCKDIRVIGVNYETWMSVWLEGCGADRGGLVGRAARLGRDVSRAGVGSAPIVWLGHSMGGILVKKIVADSFDSEDQPSRAIYNATRGMVFYSTPNRGSRIAEFGPALRKLLAPSHLVTALTQDSPLLLDLHERFLIAVDTGNIDVVSFAETKPTLVSPFKVPIHFVPASSADVGRGEFFVLPLDHLTICKPVTRQSLIYSVVVAMVCRAKSTKPVHRTSV